MKTDFFTKTKRSMLKAHKEIGAMPFLLFQYYLTWESASDGIRPSLKTVADDLGLEPNAVCNLRKKLVQFGWIKYENGRVFILKTFTPSESDSHQVNQPFTPSEDTFTPSESGFTKNESPYKEEKEQLERTKKQQENAGEGAGEELGFGQPFETQTKIAVDSSAELELERWLDAVAKYTGATGRKSLANYQKWEKVCMTAISEGRALEKLLAIIKSELERNKTTPQYFSPDTVFKTLQISSLNAAASEPPRIRTQEEKQRDFDRQHYANRKQHVVIVRATQ